MQLKVIKNDGSIEEYLHTKVMGTISKSFDLLGDPNLFAAEQFAEVITFHLYQKQDAVAVTSDQIHLMIQATLTATGYDMAAQALNEHRLSRKLQRKRIEILDDSDLGSVRRWNKGKIVNRLMKKKGFSRHLARAIASAVEEKVMKLELTRIQRSLVRQLVLADTDAMVKAQQQLQMATG
jgi:hypothetical protein